MIFGEVVTNVMDLLEYNPQVQVIKSRFIDFN